MQCAWRIDDLSLLLWPTDLTPKLNPEWVGKNRLRRRLKPLAMWLRDPTERDDGGISGMSTEGWGDVPEMAQSLGLFLATEVSGSLDPGRLENRVDIARNESIQNALGLFLIGQSRYTEGARGDLRALGEWSDSNLEPTALGSLFGAEPQSGDRLPVVPPVPLGEDQFLAVQDALSKPLTVITGPPGTGKSQVVVAFMISAAMAGRSVLFASRTHQALDAVQNRLESLHEDHALLARAWSGSSEDSFDFRRAVDAVIAQKVTSDAREALREKFPHLKQDEETILSLLGKADALARVSDEIGRLNSEKDRREAATTVGTLTKDPQPPLGGRFIIWLRKLLAWLVPHAVFDKNPLQDGDELRMSATALTRRLRALETRHRRLNAELEAATRKKMLSDALTDLCTKGKHLLPNLAVALEATSPEEAQRLVQLKGNLGLAADAGETRQLWQDNADLVLRHFPLWACSVLAVPNRIPLVPGLFDYLVIDEATTSDIASTLPLFARARHALIVGDKMQTGMVSDLDGRREKEMLFHAGLTDPRIGRFAFSQVSIFDLASSSAAASQHMLRDHFRCHPDIADYCSETFYRGRLFVRTDLSRLLTPKKMRPGLHWTDVAGPIEPLGKGCRARAEAEAMVEHLHDLLEVQSYEGTVGIVTPFKHQADLIIRLTEDRLRREDIERARLRIGTSHSFQGDDRDIVMVTGSSFGVFDDSLNALLHFFPQLVDPETTDLPARALNYVVSPEIRHLPKAVRIAVIGIAVDLYVETHVALDKSKVEPAPNKRVLSNRAQPRFSERLIEASLPWGFEDRGDIARIPVRRLQALCKTGYVLDWAALGMLQVAKDVAHGASTADGHIHELTAMTEKPLAAAGQAWSVA
jgi:hypothetical protein